MDQADGKSTQGLKKNSCTARKGIGNKSLLESPQFPFLWRAVQKPCEVINLTVIQYSQEHCRGCRIFKHIGNFEVADLIRAVDSNFNHLALPTVGTCARTSHSDTVPGENAFKVRIE